MISLRKSIFILSSAIAFFLLSGSSCDTDDPEPQPKPDAFWEMITIETNGQKLNDVYFANKYLGWIISDSGQLLKTTDAGENWQITQLADDNLNTFLSIGDTSFWIVGDNGLIMHSEDEGNSWQVKGSPVVADFKGIYFLGNKGWIVGESDDFNGIIINSNNNGQSWNWQLPPENTKGLNDVYFLSPQRGFAIGKMGWLLKTTDGGNSWESVANGSKSSLNKIIFNDTLGYIVGDFGDYLRSFNRGDSWSLQYPTFWENLKDMQFMNPDLGWVVGHSSSSYRTTDGGLNWQYQGTSEENIQINAVYFLTGIHGWAVGSDRFGNPVAMKPAK